MAIAVLLLDTIPIGLGGLIARTLGREMWVVGAGVAVWVTICFAVLIGGNVALEYAIERRALRRGRRSGETL